MYNSSYTTTNGGLGRDSVERDMLFKLSNLNSNLALTLGYLNPAFNNSALDLKSEAPRSSPIPNFVKRQLVRLLTVRKLRVVPQIFLRDSRASERQAHLKITPFLAWSDFHARSLLSLIMGGNEATRSQTAVGILNHIMFRLSYLFHYP